MELQQLTWKLIPLSYHYQACIQLLLQNFCKEEEGNSNDIEQLGYILLLLFNGSDKGNLCLNRNQIASELFSLFENITLEEHLENTSSNSFKYLEENIPYLINKYSSLFGKEFSEAPVIYSNDLERLYLLPDWKRENNLIHLLKERLEALSHEERDIFPKVDSLKIALEKVLEKSNFVISEEHRKLIEKTAENRFLILNGGPGSGKTTTLIFLLRVILFALGEKAERFIVRLSAPTGRAVLRMEESIKREIRNNPTLVDKYLPISGQTLHRLLGIGWDEKPTFSKEIPLVADMVIVDETSMVDINLFNQLFSALGSHTRVLLIGDPEQLPAVGKGGVLNDLISEIENPYHLLKESVIQLKSSHRSQDIIVQCARAIRQNKLEEFLAIFEDNRDNLEFSFLTSFNQVIKRLRSFFVNTSLSDKFYCNIQDWEEVREEINQWFDMLEDTAILSPLRKGMYGIAKINQALDSAFSEYEDYHGRFIVITGNDYELNLYNGDKGIFFRFKQHTYVFFKDSENGYRYLPVARLQEYETGYAQTIHRSQGSEFSQVILVLPPLEEDSSFLTKEHLYTAITRAKQRLILLGDKETLGKTMGRTIVKNSGITHFLLNRQEILPLVDTLSEGENMVDNLEDEIKAAFPDKEINPTNKTEVILDKDGKEINYPNLFSVEELPLKGEESKEEEPEELDRLPKQPSLF